MCREQIGSLARAGNSLTGQLPAGPRAPRVGAREALFRLEVGAPHAGHPGAVVSGARPVPLRLSGDRQHGGSPSGYSNADAIRPVPTVIYRPVSIFLPDGDENCRHFYICLRKWVPETHDTKAFCICPCHCSMENVMFSISL